MARLKQLLRQRKKGASLLEVLAAFVIISIVFVIGSQLWSTLSLYNSPERYFEMRLYMRELVQVPVEKSGIEIKESFERKGYTFIRQLTPHPESGYICYVNVKCFRGQRLVSERNRIVRIRDK